MPVPSRILWRRSRCHCIKPWAKPWSPTAPPSKPEFELLTGDDASRSRRGLAVFDPPIIGALGGGIHFRSGFRRGELASAPASIPRQRSVVISTGLKKRAEMLAQPVARPASLRPDIDRGFAAHELVIVVTGGAFDRVQHLLPVAAQPIDGGEGFAPIMLDGAIERFNILDHVGKLDRAEPLAKIFRLFADFIAHKF